MIHIIFNPNSGSESSSNKEKIIHELKSITNSVLHFTKYINHAKQLTREAIEQNAEKIIVIGGDGTINEVASQLVNQEIPLGIIPLGSGNGLARHLKIPINFNKALEKCLLGRVVEIDVVHFNDRPFFCTAGIGFDAVVAHQFAKGKKRGLINYIKSTFQSVLKYQSIQINDLSENNHELFSLTFANANQFGNNAFISPYSDIQDGLFEVIQIKPLNFLQIGELGIRLFLKNIPEHSKVKIDIQNEYYFKTKIGTLMHLDGENLFIEQEENKINISPKSLKVII
ncbi:MAG: diacylglycerol/lipid kinase family protein [Aquirufa sp.]